MRMTARSPFTGFNGFAAFALLAAACLTTAAVRAQPLVQTAYSLPNRAESGKAFSVTVSGKTGLCNPQFSHQKAVLEKNTLHLSVMAVNDPVAKCAPGEHDYEVDFDMPKLTAGSYAVNVYLQPSCMYETAACLIAIAPQYAGILEVMDAKDLSFHFTPGTAKPGKAFELFLSNRAYTCANEYSNLTVHADAYSVYLTFTNRVNPAVLCPAVVKDYGPTFKLPALEPGVYQIFATAQPYCDPKLACPMIAMLPQLAGALTVTESASTLREDGMRGTAAEGSRRGSLRIDARHGVTGAWKGAERTLTGRRQ